MDTVYVEYLVMKGLSSFLASGPKKRLLPASEAEIWCRLNGHEPAADWIQCNPDCYRRGMTIGYSIGFVHQWLPDDPHPMGDASDVSAEPEDVLDSDADAMGEREE